MIIYFYQTEIGRIAIGEEAGQITNLYFAGDDSPEDLAVSETPLLQEATKQLESYLAGELEEFLLPLRYELLL